MDGYGRYSTTASIRNHYQSSDYGKRKALKSYCLDSRTALNFTLTILLLLTILRQTFDFLGQIWLQILINFFTILIIIVALFGIRQNRISYLVLFIVWSLFNTVWNLLVISIHLKVRDINLSEDLLSLYTGATSWWHTNGPGCLSYSITASLQQSVSILKQNITSGCRFDYHLLESAQAATHSSLSLISLLICIYVSYSIRRVTPSETDKSYRLNDLTNGISKINHNPFPASRRLAEAGVIPTPRGSSSSMQRSMRYGSLSSRRSSSNRRHRRADISSLTYATTAANSRAAGTSRRSRLSSLSSADYLPSYQPPHSSSANLLSSYGEISSIDSYNNPT